MEKLREVDVDTKEILFIKLTAWNIKVIKIK